MILRSKKKSAVLRNYQVYNTYQQGFSQAGHANQKAMSASEHRRQNLLDDVGLPDNHLAKLLHHLLARLRKLLEVFGNLVGTHGGVP